MKLVYSDNLPPVIGPYSPAVKVNGMVYTSGQVPTTLDGTELEKDIKIQTRQVLSNLRTLLEESGTSMEKVVQVSIYLANIEDFAIVNVLFSEAFAEHKPARTTIAAKDLPNGYLVMADAIAAANDYH